MSEGFVFKEWAICMWIQLKPIPPETVRPKAYECVHNADLPPIICVVEGLAPISPVCCSVAIYVSE
ncbi:glutathione-dependent formaldehyde dehydrogenase [Sesbania bispinosa]|nr:glutathione-dependent formaldehyde dehydrogenase [Sesbania bispinosa]